MVGVGVGVVGVLGVVVLVLAFVVLVALLVVVTGSGCFFSGVLPGEVEVDLVLVERMRSCAGGGGGGSFLMACGRRGD